jgi:pimeloyl-ACP methyl ester carboxylesterase
MPSANLNGAHINYEIIEPAGRPRGPVIVLSPGSRNPMAEVRALAELMAAAGCRRLLHDRRNCGASDVGFDASRSEYEMWADDLHALLAHLGTGPVVIGGSSSGARLALTCALRHPGDVAALLLMRITGGRFAVERLVEKYYDQHSRAAAAGGMAAVCETEHFSEMIHNRPENRALLMALRPADFIACMEAWRAHFLAGIDLPLVGTTEAQLRSLRLPVCIVPGNDLTHPRARGALVAPLIPDAELHHVTDIERDVDVTPAEEWHAHYPAMARIFVDFLERRLGTAA